MGDGVVSRYLGNASVLAIRSPQNVVVVRFDDHPAPCAPIYSQVTRSHSRGSLRAS
jgi:hypothetical protein